MRLIGAELIDGTGIDLVRGRIVEIDGAVIAAVTTTESLAPDSETLDLSGLTWMPGLIDAHAHNLTD